MVHVFGLNWLQMSLLVLLTIFFVLVAIRPKWGWTYGRVTLLTLVATVILLPFFWLLSASVKDKDYLNEFVFLPPPGTWFKEWKRDVKPDSTPEEIASADKVLKPSLSTDSFKTLFKPNETVEGPISFSRHIINSLFLASAGTMIALFFSSLCGYALAKYSFKGKTFILSFMLASLAIPGVALLAPVYELIYSLGMLDTYASLLVPGAVSVFGIFLFRQAIIGVPDELIEAGRIDGCSEFGIYMFLVMPLVRPMSGAFCLVSFLGNWNNFLGPSIFLQTQAKMPLPTILNQYVGQYQQDYGVFLAGTLLAIIPPALLFLFLQKEFISGLSSGAVKG